MKPRILIAVACTVFALSGLFTRADAALFYSVTDLGSIDGAPKNLLGTYSVNASGQVAGISDALTGKQ
jgi:hypothetical protein